MSGQLVSGRAPSSLLTGSIEYTAYLPDAYAYDASRYRTLYLLHGRGDDHRDWHRIVGDLDALIASHKIPPVIAIMPDAPWSERASYYVDSLYAGRYSADGRPSRSQGSEPSEPAAGAAVESGIINDLLPHVDTVFRTMAEPAMRAVGGYSMGGAGALRFALVHQKLFSAALVLSVASYDPLPPATSSARLFGAYGVGNAQFCQDRYRALNYPAALADFDSEKQVRIFLGVGDNEHTGNANSPESDPVVETVRLHRALELAGISTGLRNYPGGHDWSVWAPGFSDGIQWIWPGPTAERGPYPPAPPRPPIRPTC